MPGEQYIIRNVDEEQLKSNNIYKSLYYSIIGTFTNAGDHFLERDNPDFYMVIVCTAGEGFYIVGKKKYIIKQGDIFFCFPNIYTSYGSSPENPWTIHWAHFNGTAVEELLTKYNITTKNPLFRSANTVQISDGFKQIISEHSKAPESFSFEYRQSLFNSLFFTIMKQITQKKSDDLHPAVTAAIEFIDKNLNRKLSLDTIAKETMISKYYLTHLFKSQLGISPNHYITQQRIKLAKNLLKNTSNTIASISQSTGFDNQFYFSSVFKKNTGKSPVDYRKQYV